MALYGTVADWITYAGARGTVVANDAASAAALQRASDYIRTRYVIPREPEYDADSPEVIEGSYMAAAYELATPGFFAAVFTPGERIKGAGAGPARVEFFEDAMMTGLQVSKIIAQIDALFTRGGWYPAVFVA